MSTETEILYLTVSGVRSIREEQDGSVTIELESRPTTAVINLTAEQRRLAGKYLTIPYVVDQAKADAHVRRVVGDPDDERADIGCTTLVYCDPPYVADTREERWHNKAYQFELSDDDHRRLADVLHDIRGMALISGYPGALYDELYAGWRVVSHRARTDTGTERTECLWISPAAADMQPRLF